MTDQSDNLVFTTRGYLPKSSLEERTGEIDNDVEFTTWVEYWLDGELVHRSAHVTLKRPVVAFGEAASLG
jgi:hypothetical protein